LPLDPNYSSSPSGITASATAPTVFAVTFTPVATTVAAASATATTAQPVLLKLRDKIVEKIEIASYFSFNVAKLFELLFATAFA
jgi:hypothetical protein